MFLDDICRQRLGLLEVVPIYSYIEINFKSLNDCDVHMMVVAAKTK